MIYYDIQKPLENKNAARNHSSLLRLFLQYFKISLKLAQSSGSNYFIFVADQLNQVHAIFQVCHVVALPFNHFELSDFFSDQIQNTDRSNSSVRTESNKIRRWIGEYFNFLSRLLRGSTRQCRTIRRLGRKAGRKKKG